MKKQKFIIIDGNALIHRAFHALPPLTTKDGRLVNAVYGFTSVLLKVLNEIKPNYVTITYDLPGPTFRDKIFSDYKAKRQKQPDELYEQIPMSKDIVRAFRIPMYAVQGYEADDVIGTICQHKDVDTPSIETIIVTGDMDTLQLVDYNTKVYTLKRGVKDTVLLDEKGVEEKMGGLTAKQLIDFKALRGDPSDNIPGVRGIGEKGAIDLIHAFGSLEKLYESLKKKKTSMKPRLKDLLTAQEKQAFLSKKLATIVTDVPLDFNLEECRLRPPDERILYDMLSSFGFKSLLNRLPTFQSAKKQSTLFAEVKPLSDYQKNLYAGYQHINTPEKLRSFLQKLSTVPAFALDTETDRLDSLRSKLIGMSFSWEQGRAFFVDYELMAGKTPEKKQLAAILANKNIQKYGHNIKYDLNVVLRHGFDLQGIVFDSMIAAYLLNPGSRAYSLDEQTFTEFGHRMIGIEELIGKKGNQQISMREVDRGRVATYAAEDADFTWRLSKKLEPHLKEKGVQYVFSHIEMPLIPILAAMEKKGITFNVEKVNIIKKKLEKKIQTITNKIYTLAGLKFNINSPIQLKEILFNKLKISTDNIRKTKTGISTAASELEKLRGRHEIVDHISLYREYTKLLNTYVEALPMLVDPKTKRLHTSFNQTIAATGRLSSADPNLQNIPIRTEEGQAIRGCFIAGKGRALLSLDYSQIELRIAAALSRDQNMMAIFEKGEDFHAATAAKIYNVPLEKVTKNMRSSAKAVNFGVMYGMGVYGLSQGTGITHEEAQEFIQNYYTVFAGLKDYLETIKILARKQGYVETLFGRRRYIPEINSGVVAIRRAAERVAINMPIQGTEADLVKMAMIAIHPLIEAASDIDLLLQVHDELLFEVKKGREKIWVEKLREVMENIHNLGVPIVVDAKIGQNWQDMKPITIKK